MMNRMTCILLSAALCALSVDAVAEATETARSTVAEASETNRLEAIRASAVVKVLNPTATRTALRDESRTMGGYATALTESSVSLKIPPKALPKAMAAASGSGILLTKSIDRRDLTLHISLLEGNLRSRMEILERLRSFFDESDLASTLDIERSMNRIVDEMESIKGALRVLRDQTTWAVLDISFSFPERDTVLYVSSPFEWLNTANLATFLEEF